ncbi:hypothetical protein ACWIUD_09010 [Helicobacter sp. 23-1044]
MYFKKYIATFFITSIGVIIAYFAMLVCAVKIFSLPILANAEIWLKNTYKIKDYINATPTQKRRLIIISDSNSLFGFNSALIDVKTKYKPINYATHGGLPINYHIDKIIDSAKDGDIVLMPLAFGYYTRGAPKDDLWYIQNMETWGDYDKYIDFKGRILSYSQNPPLKVAKTIIKYIFYRKISPNIISDMQDKWANIAPCEGKFEGYNYKSLSVYGDFCTQENNGDFTIKSDYGMAQSVEISAFFIDEFRRLQNFAESKNIKIILTYPATAENELFSANNTQILRNIKALQTALESLNIKIYGDFRDFIFSQKYFYDTNYHLNKNGAILRTEAVIKLLQNLEKNGEI